MSLGHKGDSRSFRQERAGKARGKGEGRDKPRSSKGGTRLTSESRRYRRGKDSPKKSKVKRSKTLERKKDKL